MSDLTNAFPTILLGVMIVLTLVLLPLLNDEGPARSEERQRADKIRVPTRKDDG